VDFFLLKCSYNYVGFGPKQNLNAPVKILFGGGLLDNTLTQLTGSQKMELGSLVSEKKYSLQIALNWSFKAQLQL
jgi:hypothetical protein